MMADKTPKPQTYRAKPRDSWELRMTMKHGLPQPFVRAWADLRNGKPD